MILNSEFGNLFKRDLGLQLLTVMMMQSGPLRDLKSMTKIKRLSISWLIEDRRGVTAIEYALIAALIAVAAIAAFTLVGTNLSNTFSYVASQL